MNVERCIELHNEILRYGWVNSGHDVSQFETAAKPWMSFFGDDGLAILPDLAPELDLDDIDRILFKRMKRYPLVKRYPLDVVLDYWLNTIRIGRIVAVPKNRPDGPFEDRLGIHPWRHRRFYDSMLNETLDAFNKLVEAIEARLPQGSSSLNDDSIEYGLADADVLQIHEIAPGFAREFLACARTPRFKHIAPGLEVITTSTFSKQPFIPNPDEKANKHDVPAILLFYSKLNYDNSPDRTEYGAGPFGYPCHQITTLPTGLYLDRTD
ncbi:hypothetical protein N0V83_008386 [Neocucurbitaria cava]|uniref:Uncharacterized protein n=1 Tax=Neocucurbitaria cava TaxID=798079 RepID=A0A9W9CJH7_9PLEO|nr:hypothetical protein N0V83_008386 [Neocucurbitaria cava]